MPDDKGHTLRKSEEQVLETPGLPDEHKLEIEEKHTFADYAPACLTHVYNWFWELHSTRGAGMSGPLPIPYLEIYSFFTLKGITPRPKEIEIIKQLDSVYLKFVNSERRKKSTTSTNSNTASPKGATSASPKKGPSIR